MAKATRGQRILIIGLLTISLMTPPIIMGIAGQSGLASAFVYGGVIAIVAAFYGLRLAVILSVVAGVAGIISALLNPHPVAGAIFFGLFTGACALSAKQGLHSPALMVPIFISFVLAAPPEVVGVSDVPAAFMTGAVLTLGGLWATGSARLLLGNRHGEGERKRLTTRAAVLYAVTMAVVLGIAAWGVLTYAKFHQGAWLLLTLIIVLQPSAHDTLTRSLQRLGGTIIGGVFAFVLILAGVQSTLALVIGGVILFAALTVRYALKRPYWEYVTVLTPAAILLNTPGLDAVSVAEDRVVFTIIATVVGVTIALALKVLITQKAPAEETT
jgi:MFS family permease